MRPRTVICLLFFLVVVSVQAEDFTGKVVGIVDGDTIDVLHNGKAERVRLDGIDCPESRQAFGSRAKQATSQLAFGKEVRVIDKGKERYGRMIGVVILPASSLYLNAALVRSGYAWQYKQYSKDPALARYETEARQAKRGLWVDSKPVPPWEFRRGDETKPPAPATPSSPIMASPTPPALPANGQVQSETVCRHPPRDGPGRFRSRSQV
jgi:micrococcal nuclease